MKKLLLSVVIAAAAGAAMAQPLRTIQSIQTVTQTRLQACDDAPTAVGDTVRVLGVVLTPGGLAQSASGRQIWIRDIAGGPFSAISVRQPVTAPTVPDDMLNAQAGDTVEVIGAVQEFLPDAESQIAPIARFQGQAVQNFRVVGPFTGTAAQRPAPVLVNISTLQDNQRVNKLETGEQHEGQFIEIQNATVTFVDNFSGNRYSFDVRDAAGNRMNVTDRFLAQRTPANNPNGTFRIIPNVGDVFTSIKGVVIHNKNGCGSGARGYQIAPFDSTHYARGASGPAITTITRAVAAPAPSAPIVINATISPGTNGNNPTPTITTVNLFYATGTDRSVAFNSVPMTVSTPGNYTATIPGQSAGTTVMYYITASNSINLSSSRPNVPAPGTDLPMFFQVVTDGPTIPQVQYAPFYLGSSTDSTRGNAPTGFVGVQVTLRGVVTATQEGTNLGQVYIQDTLAAERAGIWCTGNAVLNTLRIGQLVDITGIVEEANQMTRVIVSTANVVGNGRTINPLVLAPGALNRYNFRLNERYEGMLVTLQNPVSGSTLAVSDTNANSTPPSNFGEWRVATDLFDPATSATIQTGRQSTTAFSSLAVRFVNRNWPGLTSNPIRIVQIGDQFQSITGILQHSFNILKLTPRTNADFVGFVTSNKAVLATNLKLYPNPAAESVTIEGIEAGQVAVMDLTGRVVAQENITAAGLLNLRNLNDGVYTLRITDVSGKMVKNTKLVIAR